MKASNMTREDYRTKFNGKTGFDMKCFINKSTGVRSAKYFFNTAEFNAFYNDNKANEIVLMNKAWSSLTNKFFYKEIARIAK